MIPNDELFALATEAGLEIKSASQVAALRAVAILIYRMVAKETAEDCAKVCKDYAASCRKITCIDEADTAEALASGIRTKYQLK